VNRHLKRRNLIDTVKIGTMRGFQDESTRVSAYWVDGGRRIGGETLFQAVGWNSGKCSSDAKRTTQEVHLKSQSSNAGELGGLLHSSVEFPVMGNEQREKVTQRSK
jgi:hypothetical protein